MQRCDIWLQEATDEWEEWREAEVEAGMAIGCRVFRNHPSGTFPVPPPPPRGCHRLRFLKWDTRDLHTCFSAIRNRYVGDGKSGASSQGADLIISEN